QAYFLDNVKHAASGTRTPPDWWRQLRVEELRRESEQGRSIDGIRAAPAGGVQSEVAFRQYLETEAREVFHKVMRDLQSEFTAGGQSEEAAQRTAEDMARIHLWNRFRSEHPEHSAAKPLPIDLAALMKRSAS